jgi:hypothetical protein
MAVDIKERKIWRSTEFNDLEIQTVNNTNI